MTHAIPALCSRSEGQASEFFYGKSSWRCRFTGQHTFWDLVGSATPEACFHYCLCRRGLLLPSVWSNAVACRYFWDFCFHWPCSCSRCGCGARSLRRLIGAAAGSILGILGAYLMGLVLCANLDSGRFTVVSGGGALLVMTYIGLVIGANKGDMLNLQALGGLFGGERNSSQPKVFDTSVIIDGRAAECCASRAFSGGSATAAAVRVLRTADDRGFVRQSEAPAPGAARAGGACNAFRKCRTWKWKSSRTIFRRSPKWI